MKRPAEIRFHWNRLREIGCIVTGSTSAVQIHHCHGGSMLEMGITKGMGRKTSDWLVIPLAAELHSIGPQAIDGAMGVRTWEDVFGRQADMLDAVCDLTGVNVWLKAGVTRGHPCGRVQAADVMLPRGP